jgi:hypothetical protein
LYFPGRHGCAVGMIVVACKAQDVVSFLDSSAHPEIPNGHSEVSRLEMRDFVQDQGNQGLVRRRTGVRRLSAVPAQAGTNKAAD